MTLTGVTVTDNNIDTPPGVSCPQTTLAVGASMTCTAQHTVTQAEIDGNGGGDGDLDNTVTADSNETQPVSDDLEIPIGQSAALDVEKSSTTSSITAAGQVVPYTFTVTNTGNQTLTGVTVADPNCTSAISGPTGDSNSDGLLQTTETWVYTCSHTVTQGEIDGNGGGDGDLDNTVTADSNETGPDADDLAIPIARTPALNVEKSSTTPSITAAGQVVPYTFTVTNDGNVTLSVITVADPNCTSAISGPTGDSNSDGLLQTTETWVYTCSHTVTQAEIDGNGGGDGDLDNTVTVDSNETGPDADDLAIPIARTPALNVEKSSTTPSITAAGQVVPYTFTVTNDGNVTLSVITVADPNCTSAISGPTGDSNSDGLLQTTETWVYTCSHTVTQAEIDGNGGGDGDLDNTVTADSNETGPDTDDLAIPILQNPALNVAKSSTTTSITAAGQVVPYTFTVTNTGNVTLTGVTVSDPDCTSAISGPTGDSNSDGLLQTTETWVYTCSHTVTQGEIDGNGGGDGDLDNTVTADSNETGPDTDSLAIPIVQNPALNVAKSSTTTSITAAGQVVPYTLPGHEHRQRDADRGDGDGSTTSTTPPGVSCPQTTLAIGESMTCTAQHTVTQAEIDGNGGGDGDLDNTVTADSNETGPDTDDLEIPISQNPSMTIEKAITEVDGDTTPPFLVDAAGDVISYSILVTNTGNQTLTAVAVLDTRIANLDCDPGTAGNQTSGFTLAPSGTLTCTGTYAVTQAEIDNNGGGDGDIDNTATADSDQTGPASASADVPLDLSPALSITKVGTESSYDSVGDVIHYTIVATNTGNTTLAVTVTDPNVSDLACTPANGSSVAPGTSMTCTASHTITQANIDAGSYLNTSCVGAARTIQACDSEEVPAVQSPAISITKDPASQTFPSGGTASFTITVENTGNVTLTNVTVTDALAPGCARTSDDIAGLASLAPGASVGYECTRANVTADFTNSATVTGTPPVGADVTDTDTAAVDVIAPAINIEKTPDSQTFQTGGTATFTITVTNTGDVPLTNVTVMDALAPGCARTSAQLGANATLAAGASFSYECTQANVTADFTNSATATGTPPVGPDVTDTDTAAVTVTQPLPPPPPTIDLQIQKTDRPNPVDVGGTLTYTLTARNNGPSTATQVVITDSLPATVTYLSSSSTQGTCSVSGKVVTCAIGTMPVGATVTVTIRVRPLQPGTIRNVTVIVGAEAETNTANNRDEEPTRVTAVAVAPAAAAPVCPRLTVSTNALSVGKRSTIKALVTLRGKRVPGVRVLARGPGILKKGVSGKQGMVRISVKPARVGIVQLRITGEPGSCATKRIGVVAVFQPPLTG